MVAAFRLDFQLPCPMVTLTSNTRYELARWVCFPRIVEAVGDSIGVFFDSGIRCGADIAKAMALGARVRLIGRPYGELDLYEWDFGNNC
ncbi:alpha-hydroxy-acid oxidizing protein [Candidatus Bathyarchaeota archaeon]|nr:alpha-hydroxy-acid oxidizing protein [Candidatus Bathyarchaeota archaeon]